LAFMNAIFGFDAFSPGEIAERVQTVGVAKARLPLLSLVMLGMLAGGFIGLGSLYYVIVVGDPGLTSAVQRVLGGAVFSLGLLLVVVAGAELFTGNNLIAMAWADGKVSSRELLWNWLVVCVANFAGAVVLAALVLLSGHADKYAATYLQIAALKTSLAALASVLQRRLVQRAGVHGDLDVACRAQRGRQGGGHPAADLGVRRRGLRALGGQHVLHPARHDAAGGGRPAGGAFGSCAQPGAGDRRQPARRQRAGGAGVLRDLPLALAQGWGPGC
jgi:hypothetical protein